MLKGHGEEIMDKPGKIHALIQESSVGVQTQLAEKRSDNLELGIVQFDSGGPMVYFKENIVFQGFRRVPSFSKGVELFSGMGSIC